jgi:hypothetical protein
LNYGSERGAIEIRRPRLPKRPFLMFPTPIVRIAVWQKKRRHLSLPLRRTRSRRQRKSLPVLFC